jgi:hypothetical protein
MIITANRRQMLAGASAATSLAPLVASAQETTGATFGKTSRLASELFAAKAAPALSLAVAESDHLVWAEALGTVNLELDVSSTTRHRSGFG